MLKQALRFFHFISITGIHPVLDYYRRLRKSAKAFHSSRQLQTVIRKWDATDSHHPPAL
ncbi:hypothetical protein QOZ95_000363 [Paenibacillus brasilensis]|uniref:Transposase n=1 Tax=Paenibacillus brasilensis TaxID=128574 RepID=A0ABU0KRZ9_9BACL|nr:hypothetical protein [Paenibacillus brasilensis]